MDTIHFVDDFLRRPVLKSLAWPSRCLNISLLLLWLCRPCQGAAKKVRYESATVRCVGPHVPTSCGELHSLSTTFSDDYYWLPLLSTEGTSVAGEALYYCSDMISCNPATYLPLPAGNSANFAHTDIRRSSDARNCDKATHDSVYGKTIFSAVRLNPGNIYQLWRFNETYGPDKVVELVPDDYHFADTLFGRPMPYGQAKDCMSELQRCHEGEMRVNLTGTGFVIHPETEWTTFGNAGSIVSMEISESRETARAVCGGWRGGCRPSKWKLIYNPELVDQNRNATRVTLTTGPLSDSKLPGAVASLKTHTVTECARECDLYPGCSSINWHKQENICELNNGTVAGTLCLELQPAQGFTYVEKAGICLTED